MTTIQKTLVTATIIAAVGTGIYEARRASILRNQIQTLQQQQTPLTAQIQQLQHERDDATNQVASLRDENERLDHNTAELLRLRNEVSILRHNQTAQEQTAGSVISQSTQNGVPANKESSPENIGRELGMAVVRGDPGALDKVLNSAKSERDSFNTNSVGLDDTHRGELSRQTFAPLRAAFDVIAEAASQNNQFALAALARATQTPELKGLAVQSLGTLAGSGNDGALGMLLNYQKYGFLLSTTVGALQPAADNGNQKAIDALAAVARDETKQPLWYMAASGLAKAAEAGNSVAVDTLIGLLASTNRNVQNTAISGLKKAAANQNVKAAEALRSVGIQQP